MKNGSVGLATLFCQFTEPSHSCLKNMDKTQNNVPKHTVC